MKRVHSWASIVGLSLLAVGCGGSTSEPARTAATSAPAADAAKVAYKEPRFPSYLKPPASIDEVLPYVRPLARAKSGLQGAGLGILEKGDAVLIVTTIESETMIVDAVKKALEERGVTVDVKRDFELVGVPQKAAEDYRKVRRTYTSEQGYMEAANWVEGNFPEPEKAKDWLRQRNPALADKLFPRERELSAAQKAIYETMRGENVGKAIREYLEKHPTYRGAFWGKGGSTTLRRFMHPAEKKFLGTFLVDNRWDVMSRQGTYPGDLWQLAEDQSMEPLVHVDRLEVTDPEGTHLTSDISEQSALNWSRGVYQRGHLYMFPNQATGRFGYSVIDYPAFQGEWLPREPMALANGIISGTTNHTGYYPNWKVTVQGGYIRGVEGGGLFGDALKEFLQFPNINDQLVPFHNPEHPGYWWLYEIGMGTHPKAFRNVAGLEIGQSTPERNRSGVFHWGLGVTLHHDPGQPVKSQKLTDFTARYNLPRDHGWHTHTYFSTYRVHLRNADRWIDITDKGRLTSLDNPEVRALASRYGDPGDLLEEDWVPGVDGINLPGSYADFAKNPWKRIWGDILKVMDGTYDHFYPKPSAPAKTGN